MVVSWYEVCTDCYTATFCPGRCHSAVTLLLALSGNPALGSSWLHTVIPWLSLGLPWVEAGLRKADLAGAPGNIMPILCWDLFLYSVNEYLTERALCGFRLGILLNFSELCWKGTSVSFSRHHHPQTHGKKVKSMSVNFLEKFHTAR